MRRKEFIAEWVKVRQEFCAEEVKAGKMRVSESIVNTMDDATNAVKMWRKYRGALAPMTAEQCARWLRDKKKIEGQREESHG